MSDERSLLLIGTGLIGGSFALAAKACGLYDRVVGMDRDERALDAAMRLGVIDASTDVVDECCDAACVAVPVGGIAPCVRDAAAKVPLVFDVGSVKRPIIDALRPLPSNYVPCHPIAGSERSGAAAARADLFRDRTVVLTPTPGTDATATAAVRELWQAIGGRVVVESAAVHDDRFALVSHLPHLVAFAFMEVASRADSLAQVGGGFRDFTRIAAADADVWVDILRGNLGPVRRHLDALIESLNGYVAAAEGDGEALRSRIAAAAAAKRALPASS